MAECAELSATMAALREHIGARDGEWLDPGTISVSPYAGPDTRIGWERTCIVTAIWKDGNRGVVGFTDAIPESKNGDENESL